MEQKVKKGFIKPMGNMVPSLMQYTIILLAALLANRCYADEILQRDSCVVVRYMQNGVIEWIYSDDLAALTDRDYSTVFTKSDLDVIEVSDSCANEV